MQIGIAGLGRMGANMARRLLKGGHRVVVFNRSPKPVDSSRGESVFQDRLLSAMRYQFGGHMEKVAAK